MVERYIADRLFVWFVTVKVRYSPSRFQYFNKFVKIVQCCDICHMAALTIRFRAELDYEETYELYMPVLELYTTIKMQSSHKFFNLKVISYFSAVIKMSYVTLFKQTVTIRFE